jgi:signal transduction histidine kinase
VTAGWGVEQVPVDAPLLADTLATGKTVVFDDGGCCSRSECVAVKHGMRSGAAVGVTNGASPLGVLAVFCGAPRTWGGEDCNFLRSIAAILESAYTRQAIDETLLLAEQEERRRISEAIHDDPLQVMSAVALRLELFGRSAPDHERDRVNELVTEVRQAGTRLRDLVFDLFPDDIEEVSLPEALRQVLVEASKFGGFRFELEDELSVRPPRASAIVLFRRRKRRS